MDLIDKKGLIVIDNVLWHGEVADDTNNDNTPDYLDAEF